MQPFGTNSRHGSVSRNDEDSVLVKGCMENQRTSQKQFYDKFAPAMLGLCMRYTRSKDEAEDIMIEGFMKAFTYMSSYRFECSLESWLRRIMINNAISHYRANVKYDSHVSIDDVQIDSGNAGFSKNAEMAISEKEILKTIQKMPDGFRIVFNLFAIEGYSHKEIAQQLSIAEGTSKSQFARARQWLQNALAADYNRNRKREK